MVTPNSTVNALGKWNFFGGAGLSAGNLRAAAFDAAGFVVAMVLPLVDGAISDPFTEPPAEGSADLPIGLRSEDLLPLSPMPSGAEGESTEKKRGMR
jgi:hypothetical protein